MHLYKSTAGLVIDEVGSGEIVAMLYPWAGGRAPFTGLFSHPNEVVFPVIREPAWKTAAWIAEVMEADNPWVELNRKLLLALGVFIDGDTICMPPSYGQEVLLAVDILVREGGYFIDATRDRYL